MDLNEIDNLDLYLDSLYIRKKTDKNRIISLYEKYLKQNKRISEFKKGLEKLGWGDITIENICHYIINWNYRNAINKRLGG